MRWIALVLLAACATGPKQPPTPYRDLLDPVDLVRALNDFPDGPDVYGRQATVDMLVAVPTAKFAQLIGRVHHELGKLKNAKLLHREPLDGGGEQILVEATYPKGTLGFTLSLDSHGRLAGLLIKPLAGGAGPADDYRAHRAYGLPVLGEWTVGNGGRDAAHNLHVGNAQQWYAYDLLRTDAAGHSCPEEAKGNAGCLAFGQDVVAPADGTVTFTADGIPDNVAPGEMDEYFVPGNTIGLDHGDGEFSFLCHLEVGTLKVHPGDRVKRGQPLAKVGNSGHSSEPHLHWHLGSNARLGLGHGLPIRFGPLTVNGKLVEAPEPVQNDRVSEGK
jgi:hypothetical protein